MVDYPYFEATSFYLIKGRRNDCEDSKNIIVTKSLSKYFKLLQALCYNLLNNVFIEFGLKRSLNRND